jgi:hypothetical protein
MKIKTSSLVPFHLMSVLLMALHGLSVFDRVEAVTVPPDLIAAQLNSAQIVADVFIESLAPVTDPNAITKTIASATILKVHRQNSRQSNVRERDNVEIEVFGGEINGQGVMYSGLPRPYKGQSYRVFLNPTNSNGINRYVITGFQEGLKPLTQMRQSSRNRTDGSNGEGDGPFLYWDSRYFPLQFMISAPSFKSHPDFVEAIEESFKPWRNDADVLVEFIAQGCNQSTKNENDSLNTIILVTQNWPFESAAIAVTRNFYISGTGSNAGMILDSDILLNGVSFPFSITGEAGKHDIRNIVTHEVGHFLGFGHEIAPIDEEATMFASAVAGETKKRDLATNDVQILHSAYAGVGTKFDNQKIHCAIPDTTVGCLSVHSSETKNLDYVWLLLYLLGTLTLGKWTTKRYGFTFGGLNRQK